MGSFGENLRREREMRGVTLEEISAATKISARFLQAIENDQFSKLPGGIFARSFIRAYARYLGLEEEPLIAEFQTVAQPDGEVDLTRIPVSKRVSPHEKSRAPFFALLVAAALLAGGYAIFRYSRRVPEIPTKVAAPAPTPTPPATSATVPPPGAEATQTPASSTTEQPVGTPGSEPTSAAPSPPSPISTITPFLDPEGGLVLQVAATERTWVAVEADGRMALQRVLNPNEVESIKAKEFFDLTTGNASGIILTLNGETLNPLGRRGEVKKVHLTRAELKNPAP